MRDPFGRSITYLRISVTDRCNLRCRYCMPDGYLGGEKPSALLSYEELALVGEAMVRCGVRKFRLTGGEPLIRKDLHVLVGYLNASPQVTDIALSTNAILLRRNAKRLKDAGLTRVNISLDTLRPEIFTRISQNQTLDEVLDGIAAAEEVGLEPIKLNTVIMRGVNDDEVCDLAGLTIDKGWTVRFIEVMPLRQNPGKQRGMYVSADETRSAIEDRFGALEAIERGANSGPAEEFRIAGARGRVGFITPLSHTFCDTCNRVRLTSTGKLRLCLFGESGADLREPIRSGASVDDLVGIIQAALPSKPKSHHLALGYSGPEAPITMSQIGG